jgi:hypothetical protein
MIDYLLSSGSGAQTSTLFNDGGKCKKYTLESGFVQAPGL